MESKESQLTPNSLITFANNQYLFINTITNQIFLTNDDTTLLSELIYEYTKEYNMGKYIWFLHSIINDKLVHYKVLHYNKDMVFKCIIMLIFYIIKNESSSQANTLLIILFRIICRLYHSNYLSSKDFKFAFSFMIQWGLIEKSHLGTDRSMLFGYAFDLLTEVLSINNTVIKDVILIDIFDYFKQIIIIDNPSLLFSLSKRMTYLHFGSVLYKTYSKIQDEATKVKILEKWDEIMIPIYQGKFSFNTMKSLVNMTKDCIINYNTKQPHDLMHDLANSRYQMEVLTKYLLLDYKKNHNDKYALNRGFMFHGSDMKGMKINLTSQIKNCSFIFSFNLILSKVQEEDDDYPILSIIAPQRDSVKILSFSIKKINEKYKFIFATSHETIDNDILIQPNTSYLFIITINPPMTGSNTTIKIKYNDFPLIIFNSKKRIKDERTICYIGTEPQDNHTPTPNKPLKVFHGEIGTVFFLKDIISEQSALNILNCRGNYEDLLFTAYHEKDYLLKYTSKSFQVDHAFNNVLKSLSDQIIKTIIFYISPLSFQYTYDDQGNILKPYKSSYKFNYLNINQNELAFQAKIELLSQLSDDFTIFLRNSTLYEFLSRKGFNYIHLQFEYYLSLLASNNHMNSNELMGQLDLNIEGMLKLFLALFDEIIIEENYTEIMTVLSYFSELITKAFNAQINHYITFNIFNYLISIIIKADPNLQPNPSFLLKENLLVIQRYLVSLILNADLYSNDNLQLYNDLFMNFIKFIQSQESFFIKSYYFQKIIPFAKIYTIDFDPKYISIEKNFQLILSFYLDSSDNHYIFLHDLMEYLRHSCNDIRINYSLLNEFYCNDNIYILSMLNTHCSLSNHLIGLISGNRLEDKYFNLFLQILLTFKDDIIMNDIPKFSAYPLDLIIRNLILSLYYHEDNTTKMTIINNRNDKDFSFDILDKTLDYDIFRLIIAQCSYFIDETRNRNIFVQTQSNKEINNGTDENGSIYTFLMKFLKRQLSLGEGNPMFETLYDEHEDICHSLFMIGIAFNIPYEKDLLYFVQELLLKHKTPFIFSLLKTFIQLKLSPELIIQINNIISSKLCTAQKIDGYLINNIIHFILCIESLMNSSLCNSKEILDNQIFNDIVQILRFTSIIYSPIYVIGYSSEEPKIIMEIIFDLCLQHYLITKDKNYLNDLKKYFTFDNSPLKFSTPIINLDLVNDSSFSLDLTLINGEIMEMFPQRKNDQRKYDIKFTMYFLIKVLLLMKEHEGNDDCDFEMSLEYIAKGLCKDILILIEKNALGECSHDLYKELLKIFTLSYKTNGYEALKNAYWNLLKNKKEQERVMIQQFKDMDIGKVNGRDVMRKNKKSIKGSTKRIIKTKPIDMKNKQQEYIDYTLSNSILFRSFNKSLIKTTFALYFKDILFHNKEFIKLKNYYINRFPVNKHTKALNYPSKRKNFAYNYQQPIFLKQDNDFFTSSYFPITHQYYKSKLLQVKLQNITLMKRPVTFPHYDYSIQCELITCEYALFGSIKLTKDYFLFNQEQINSKYNEEIQYFFASLKEDHVQRKSFKQILISLPEIREIIIRRYLLMWQAFEIYTNDGKSYFFNLFKVEDRKDCFERLKQLLPNKIIIDDSILEFKLRKYTNDWINGGISTYDYLMYINNFSSRTFNDINQYVVFPWILLNYTNFGSDKNLEMRNFEKPIGLQKKTDKKLKEEKNKSQDKGMTKYIGTNFSAGSFVQYFLMRMNPFIIQLIRYNKKGLDHADRVFKSFDSILQDLFTTSSDNRELVPEVYSSCESMINFNCISFGKTQKSIQIDDILFDEVNTSHIILSRYISLIILHRKLLNSGTIAKNISIWLDYYFGLKQVQLKDKFKICNKWSYESKARLNQRLEKHKFNKMPQKESNKKIREKIDFLFSLGQTPCQLFYSSHAASKLKKKVKISKESIIDLTSLLISNQKQSKTIIFFTFNKSNTMIYSLSTSRKISVFQLADYKKVSDVKCDHFKLFKEKYKNNHNDDSTTSLNFNTMHYIIRPKYAFAILDGKILITGRYYNKSFKVQTIKSNNDPIKQVLTNDFVNTIAEVDDHHILTGLRSGELIEWEIQWDSTSLVLDTDDIIIKPKKSVIAHYKAINAIVISHDLNIIISSGDDNMIFIRKSYDFELLTSIPVDPNFLVVDIVISSYNLIYTLCYNKTEHKYCIKGYTMTGINFATSPYDLYNDIECLSNGAIEVGYCDRNTICQLSGSTLDPSQEPIELCSDDSLRFASFKINQESQKRFVIYSSLINKDTKH